MKRNEYLSLHEIVEEANPQTGRKRRILRYRGPYYPLDYPLLCRKRKKWVGLYILCLTCFIGAGLTPCKGQHVMFILPFFITTLFPLFTGGCALSRISRIRQSRMDELQRQEGFFSLRHSSLGLMVLSASWLAGETVLLLTENQLPSTEWLFWLFALLQTGSSILLYLAIKRYPLPQRQP